MIVSSLLNIWLLLTAAIDPGLAPFSCDGLEKPCSSQSQLHRHPPLNLPVLVFSPTASSDVLTESFSQVPVASLKIANEFLGLTQSEFRDAFLAMAESFEQAIFESEAVILNWQAELIIARLERAAQGQGLKSLVANRDWAEYERLIQPAQTLTIVDVEPTLKTPSSPKTELNQGILETAKFWGKGAFGVANELNSWIWQQGRGIGQMVRNLQFAVERRRLPSPEWEAELIQLGSPLDCE